jgi:DNA-directed RNA polymerase specialized sigma24 family protein
MMQNHRDPLEIQAQLNRLHEVIAQMLTSKGNDTSQKLLLFIKRTLRQFNLDHQLHESEIVIEAYVRTHKKIEAGEIIENIPSWLNGVSFNIIREHSRKAVKSKILPSKIYTESFSYSEIDSPLVDSQEIESLLAAWKQLKPEEVELLILRHVRCLSWQEISDYLEQKEGETTKKRSVVSLRKKGERALARLKQKYFSY